jgi:hypothetical protein
MGILDILNQYANPASAPHADAETHFDQVAQEASPKDLSNGISSAFRSDATPDFGDMVGNLFGRSDPQQRAGMLNQLIQGIGPGALGGLAGGVLGRILGQPTGAAVPTVTPAQASQVSEDDVRAIAAGAQKHDDSIVDKVSDFYAQHPTLVKSLGAAALAMVLNGMRKR